MSGLVLIACGVGWYLAVRLALDLRRMRQSRDAAGDTIALQQRLITALKTANAEKDLAMVMVLKAVEDDLDERSFAWVPADTRADAKYRSVH